jgi:hypothetical protein
MGMRGKMLNKAHLSSMSDKQLAQVLKYIVAIFDRAGRIVSDIVEIQNERYHKEHFRS